MNSLQEKEERKIARERQRGLNLFHKENKYKMKKIKPPFGDLGSFIACGEVLSFIGHEDEVKELLTSLCHNAYGYFVMHLRSLRGFLMPWTPEFNAAINFGEDCEEWHHEFPQVKELSALPSHLPVNLKEIRYKCRGNNGALTAIQFVFAKGFESPYFFEQSGFGDREREKLHVIKVDPTRNIRKIGMIVHEDD